MNEKWNNLISSIESNPVIEKIVELLTKDEENASVQVVDKLETECVVSFEFKPKQWVKYKNLNIWIKIEKKKLSYLI